MKTRKTHRHAAAYAHAASGKTYVFVNGCLVLDSEKETVLTAAPADSK